MAGAVDLSGLKARAEATAAQQARPAPSGEAGPAGGALGHGVIDVTDQNFPAEVIDRSANQLVVVLLAAAYSEQSREMSAVLEKLAAADAGRWTLARVDVDSAPGVAQAFGAKSVPMVIAVAAGRAITAFAGAQPEQAARGWLDDVLAQLPPEFGGAAAGEEPADPRREAAEQLAADGDYDGARAAYEAILHAHPGDAEAAAAVKQMAFFARATAGEPGAIARADAATGATGEERVALALAAADEELMTGSPKDAFDRLIAGIRSTAGDDRAALRTRLLELFELFDPADAVVLAARRDLAAALF
ncbi:tetratricopeptide repeat protein [Tsukamurella asaccharolytica]|uniref:Tetratricopeptide repeat protein n=2 Tax=Tsukamurella asaccharolytica TaxID=2592067 RepID=A0A5C5R7N9_9ACTN|nr:tetratricopeptide repeat protein [Tsukamurella asaccharolytica]TWS18632.1 tetratricopeptide repeat protein [Tsukamurella asaccharolytica]